jgi:hypothetical protein
LIGQKITAPKAQARMNGSPRAIHQRSTPGNGEIDLDPAGHSGASYQVRLDLADDPAHELVGRAAVSGGRRLTSSILKGLTGTDASVHF